MSGVRIELTLTHRQAEAVLRAELLLGSGVRRSLDLADAERRLHAAIRTALEHSNDPPRSQTEPGA